MRILWHMPTLRRAGCGLSRRAVELARRMAAERAGTITFVVAEDKTDVAGGTIGGLPVRILPDARRRAWHWSRQARARRGAAEEQVERILNDATLRHDLFVSCQPEAVTAYAATRGRSPVVFACGGTTLLHDAAEEMRQSSLGTAQEQNERLRGLAGPPACRLADRPFTLFMRDSLSAFRRVPYRLDRRWKRENERQAFAAADAVVFDSNQTRETVIAAYRVAPRRCHTVYGGVDEGAFRPATPDQRRAARASLGLTPEGLVVVWTGRLSPEKNVELLLRALPRCRKRPDAVLLVGDGPESAALRRLATDDLGLGGRVRFVGEQPDVRPFLHAADIFAFPSRGESFGGALAEALACGLACVALRPNGRDIRTASTEIIEHQRCGLLADPPTAEAFAAALDHLASSADERRRLGLEARRRACARFTWDAGARRFGEIISELVRLAGRSDIDGGIEATGGFPPERSRTPAGAAGR
jgi:glycosyltransferase involved in cell wall biosynthesis